jgi:hypothetical protein
MRLAEKLDWKGLMYCRNWKDMNQTVQITNSKEADIKHSTL